MDGNNKYFPVHCLSLSGWHTPIDQQYVQCNDKDLAPFLCEVSSQELRNGAYRYIQGYSRFLRGLSNRPTRRKRQGRQTVLVTRELFEFVPAGKTKTVHGDGIREHRLLIGTVMANQKTAVDFREALQKGLGPNQKHASIDWPG